MSWIEKKYINMVSSRLERFKWKSPNLANSRCPLCHDSATNKRKARGYFYEKDGCWLYHCHNSCGTFRFPTFLKQIDSRLYGEMQLEILQSKYTGEREPEYKQEHNEKERFEQLPLYDALRELKRITALPHEHPAYQYLETRKIPLYYKTLFRWCPDFKRWTNLLIPNKFARETLQFVEGRIILPYMDKDGTFFAYNGRAITDNGVRYVKIVLNHDIPHIFGMDHVDVRKDIYVFEGEFDSIFFKNAIAVGGQNLNQLTYLTDNDRFIVVFDNEPRSSDTKKKILQAIDHNFRVCIWPENMEYKDVNKMILNGYTADQLDYIIKKNTFFGPKAKVRLQEWSKVR